MDSRDNVTAQRAANDTALPQAPTTDNFRCETDYAGRRVLSSKSKRGKKSIFANVSGEITSLSAATDGDTLIDKVRSILWALQSISVDHLGNAAPDPNFQMFHFICLDLLDDFMDDFDEVVSLAREADSLRMRENSAS